MKRKEPNTTHAYTHRRSQGRRARVEDCNRRNNNKKPTKWEYIRIGNYLKWKWTKCSNQERQGSLFSMIKKTKPSVCYRREIHFRCKGALRPKVKEQEKILHSNGNPKKAVVTTSASGKVAANPPDHTCHRRPLCGPDSAVLVPNSQPSPEQVKTHSYEHGP